jgi:hypothetical protein
MQGVITGPALPDTRIELHRGTTTTLMLAPEDAANLCRLPEAYSLSVADQAAIYAITHDRESALQRLIDANPTFFTSLSNAPTPSAY